MDDTAQPGVGMNPAVGVPGNRQVVLGRSDPDQHDITRLDGITGRGKAQCRRIGQPGAKLAQAQGIARREPRGWPECRAQHADAVESGCRIAAMQPPRSPQQRLCGAGQLNPGHPLGTA